MRSGRMVMGLAVLGLVVAPCSDGAAYKQVYDSATALAGTGSGFLDTVIVGNSDITYAFGRLGENNIIAVNGETLSKSPVLTNAQWTASGDLGAFYSARQIADDIYFTNFLSNEYYKVNIGTGNVTTIASTGAFTAATGLGQVGLTSAAVVTPLGEAFVYDNQSDSILRSDAAGNVSVLISDAQLTNLAGSDSVTGGMEVIGPYLYFGIDASHMMYRWNIYTGVGEAVFSSSAVVDNLTNSDNDVDFEDIFLGNDGWVYFFEDDSDSILKFDPLNPDNVEIVLTEQQLNDGPGSDQVRQFSWYNNRLAWTVSGSDTSDTAGFYVIPEPASLALVALGGAMFLSRRK